MPNRTMKQLRRTEKDSRHHRRATVLVLAVVLVALLAILASTFVINTRINLKAVKNQVGGSANEAAVNIQEIDISVDSIISQIQTTLAEDLWGRPEDALATGTGAQGTMNNLRLLGLPMDNAGVTAGTVGTNASVNYTAGNGPAAPGFYILNEPWDAPTRFYGSANFPYYDGGVWTVMPLNVDGDPWLANSQSVYKTTADPGIAANGFYWSQGSDLFVVKFTDPDFNNNGTADDPADYFPLYAAGHSVFTNIPALEVNGATDDQRERYADADGDGVLDSVWLYQKGFFSENPNTGLYEAETYADPDGDTNYEGLVADLPIKSSDPDLAYRMAVRIVDTSGMVNVNTAWSWPDPANPETFMGNTLAGVNLSNTAFGYDNTGSRTEAEYCLPGRLESDVSDANLLTYQNSYIFQIETPDWVTLNADLPGFSPLDVSDEMELRYKWASPGLGYVDGSLEPGNRSVVETRFTELYGDTDGSGEINDSNSNEEFDNADAGYAGLAKRSKLTAYSFSRNFRQHQQIKSPAGNATDYKLDALGADGTALSCAGTNDGFFPRKINFLRGLRQWILYSKGGNTAITDEDGFRSLPLALYEVFKLGHGDIDGNPDTDAHWAHLTAQYIANLIDYMDDDNEPTVLLEADFDTLLPDWNTVTGQTFVGGQEKHVVITEAYAYRHRQEADTSIKSDDRYAVEIYNPWDVALPIAQLKLVVYDGTAEKPYLLTGQANLGSGERLVICNNTSGLTIDSGARSFVSSTLVLPNSPNGYISLKYPVTVGATTYDVVQDYFACDIGDEPGVIAEIPGPPVIPPEDGYKWNSITRNDDEFWTFIDHQKSVSDEQQAVLPTVPTTAVIPSLGSDNTFDTTSTVPPWATTWKQFGFTFDDTLNCTTWSGLTDQEQRDKLLSIIPNFGTLSLPLLLGDLPLDASDDLRQPLSVRLETVTNEGSIRFDYTSAIGGYMLDMFTILDRSSDGLDQNGDGIVDDLNEMRLPGVINVNATSSDAIRALSFWIDVTTAGTMASGQYMATTALISQLQMLVGNAGADTFVGTTDDDEGIVGIWDDLEEQQMVWSRIANLITTRSDTFVAYIYVQALDVDGNVVAEKREMALFDRSLCNEPPLQFNKGPDGTEGTADDFWEPNPAYKPVKVVARQEVE